jgi:Cu2+-exporting ATPase
MELVRSKNHELRIMGKHEHGSMVHPPSHKATEGHGEMRPASEMSYWEKLKMSMTMTMGMEHGGLAGREMAQLMEEDIRNKFFVSLLLTIPIVAYSPLGANILGLRLPEPIPAPWILFILTTPVYFFSGWIFLYSSYKALLSKTLNMAVLIAVGITAAYIFSIVLTLLGSKESFYEAAAMLTTFVLFGHWMEMKSRRGTTDALQALFNLVPPQARVVRNGRETLTPTAQVKVGDTIVLKPGDRVAVDGEILEGEHR